MYVVPENMDHNGQKGGREIEGGTLSDTYELHKDIDSSGTERIGL
jgi:hypothetical protein